MNDNSISRNVVECMCTYNLCQVWIIPKYNWFHKIRLHTFIDLGRYTHFVIQLFSRDSTFFYYAIIICELYYLLMSDDSRDFAVETSTNLDISY